VGKAVLIRRCTLPNGTQRKGHWSLEMMEASSIGVVEL